MKSLLIYLNFHPDCRLEESMFQRFERIGSVSEAVG
jgi:hypothetical protein